MTTQLKQTWNLDVFFAGGSTSPAFEQYLSDLEGALAAQKEKMASLGSTDEPGGLDRWVGVIEGAMKIEKMIIQSFAFTECLNAQNVKDEPAKLKRGRMFDLVAAYESITNDLNAEILKLSDAAFAKLLADPRVAAIEFPLRERRDLAKEKMDPQRENLATDLAVDGYHGWGSLYDTIVGRITVPVEEDGKVQDLSVGQAFNKFTSPDRAFRQKLFGSWEEAWGNQAELISSTLNHLAGFRLNLYRHRGWQSVLKEPLAVNRMTEATLNAMWEAVRSAHPKLKQYLQRKAQVMGWEKVNWYDLGAPISSVTKKYSYDEAAAFIIEQFGRFSPNMADFAAHALKNQWIEAEDRPNKAPGGFCTSFPDTAESRIFLTFGGDTGSVSTIAHELGHAYHSHVMFDQPIMTQNYAMNVAETASTFAELVTTNGAIAAATTKEEKLSLLDEKLDNAVSYLMNIYARFLFETRFYEARRKGALSTDQLNELMVAAQKEAYADTLGVYHPLFWAAKGHFYATSAPFYNFPYTFGFLFSAGIYAQALAEGPSFQNRFVALLQDTGRATVEELGKKHLGADMTKPDFWLSGVKLTLDDVDEFLRVTAK